MSPDMSPWATLLLVTASSLLYCHRKTPTCFPATFPVAQRQDYRLLNLRLPAARGPVTVSRPAKVS